MNITVRSRASTRTKGAPCGNRNIKQQAEPTAADTYTIDKGSQTISSAIDFRARAARSDTQRGWWNNEQVGKKGAKGHLDWNGVRRPGPIDLHYIEAPAWIPSSILLLMRSRHSRRNLHKRTHFERSGFRYFDVSRD